MAIYRFKVTFEDHEEVYREIEIKSTQTFEDFHFSIIKSVDFIGDYDASFFISDDYWRKGEEIVLRNLPETHSKKHKEEVVPKRLMNKCKMASLIDDPHQKFVYVYDPHSHWTFMVELLKIVPDDIKASYPKCAKSVGIAPKNVKAPIIPSVIEDDEDFDDEPHTDDEAYQNAHCEDGIAELEGEEGELEESDDNGELAEEAEEDGADFEDFADQQFEED